jgi:hypothetical protein
MISSNNWVGQLLFPWASQQSLPSRGTPCSQDAAPVAVWQAPNLVAGDQEVLGGRTSRGIGLSPPHQTDQQFSVGDIVRLSPRAGCGRSARPVR